ncbi:d-alanyl-d-alanine dipeptidase [Leptolyngbya sp. Heron Island J]|uniref:M15 family metallopeptidase n=1 Tax=Leptolyngbya sp. Heron Island J TaxID=1385935 RepID=UPI0003B9E783|nr:M15 family metallopeptidase [Leptolyngbya sp. Heron Island J]ESA38571.1 d-alanyl-d-alanine dipeptidase [Leptolyngbya sp. Heron Island J]
MMAKPYQRVPIEDCGEPLVPIPLEQFAVVTPHPYAALGAPYGELSPYYVRQGILQALLQAQASLQINNPGWRIQIFDAYRPIAVQRFMVEHTYEQLLQDWQRQSPGRTREIAPREDLLAEVYQFWAAPSHDVATPPPHSTGAAVDITLVDGQQQVVDMGSAIDEISLRSHPHYFADQPNGEIFHHHRTILSQAMQTAGFRQHPHEWWHFSRGDQLWAWLENTAPAQYGRID